MENGTLNSPPCPSTVTVRRNPPRRARPTPSTNPVASRTFSSSRLPEISSFPIQDILSDEIPQSEATISSDSKPTESESENLKVFLRVRPLVPSSTKGSTKVAADRSRGRNVWPQNPSKRNTGNEKNPKKKADENCIKIGDDSCSVTLSPPEALQDSKRSKTEIYEGFSRVFSADSTQTEVYDKMVNPLVEDFLRGKSRMLAALGPTGSGKTHTMFGTPREPGMVPQALKRIFQQTEGRGTEFPRKFHLSIFEISSDRGKSEKICDLCPDGTDMHSQQSSTKGVQEVLIHDVAQAESLIFHAMSKRFTAATNSNSQSSRSQCIINISSMIEKAKVATLNPAVLTFVDLAGAEREKRTGNLGARLLESNFINNTSLVFGLCLRALIEHQKNPKKPLQKHFQNSLLTRYLRDYLEGKKHMALIITLKPGEEDYLDASYLLRQASPYMKIKFVKVEEEISLPSNKRHIQTLPRLEQPKRMKVTRPDTCKNEEKDVSKENQCLKEDAHQMRNHLIMQNFAKALWNVLKEYKEKLKVAENEILNLREDLSYEKKKSLDVKKELDNLKSRSISSMENSTGSTAVTIDGNCVPSVHLEQDTSCSANETNFEVHFPYSTVVECARTPRSSELSSGKDEVLSQVQREAISSKLGAAEYLTDKQDPEATDDHSRNPDAVVAYALSISAENLNCCLDYQNEIDMAVAEYANRKHKSLEELDCVVVEDDITNIEASEIGVSSSSDDSSSSTDPAQQLSENDKDTKDLAALPKSNDIVPETETRPDSTCKPPNIEEPKSPDSTCKPPNIIKPKRRLMPASSVLLRNISTLEVEDDVDIPQKPKGNRGWKKPAVEEKQRTPGNISFVRLLQKNLHL